MASLSEKRIADLQALLALSRELAVTLELAPLLRKIELAARKVLGCERATVFVYDRARAELRTRLATGVEEIRIGADTGVAGAVARTGKTVRIPDAYADPRFNPDVDRLTGFKTRDMIAFPLVGFDNSVIGVLQVLNKISGAFDEWDDALVENFGAQVGVAIQRQMLLDEYAEKQRLQQDMDIARRVQESLLPLRPPAIPGFDISGWNKPASETGGDCFDFLELKDGRLAILVADATGHGLGAALMIAECRALFRATVSMSADLSLVHARLNELLLADLLDDKFVTAFFSVLSPGEHKLAFLSAGQGPLVKYVRASDAFADLAADTVPLGVTRRLSVKDPETFVMQPGDMMVLVTDGFLEWANPQGEQFGVERLCDVIREHRDMASEDIIKLMHRAVLAFAAGTVQSDDLTAVIIKRSGAP